jgi:glucose-6-phosphate isomerase
MTHVRFDYSKALTFFGEHELTYLRDAVKVFMRKQEPAAIF